MMAKKILVIPDVHGRTFWKEPVMHYLNDVDRVVFLGDYLDPYYGIETDIADDIFSNLIDILCLKLNNMEKVVLLKGNHDQHYASELFRKLAGGSRLDKGHWQKYHETFIDYKDLFQLVYLEVVKDTTYLFSHAGLTIYWLNKVNSTVWKLADNKVSVKDSAIIERINALDDEGLGQEMLAVIGRERSWFGGEKTGSVLWADINEHPMPEPKPVYGLDKVFQVFGHTRLDGEQENLVEFNHFAMIDSQKCFMIDEAVDKKIFPIQQDL